jgi:hypothetical protein
MPDRSLQTNLTRTLNIRVNTPGMQLSDIGLGQASQSGPSHRNGGSSFGDGDNWSQGTAVRYDYVAVEAAMEVSKSQRGGNASVMVDSPCRAWGRWFDRLTMTLGARVVQPDSDRLEKGAILFLHYGMYDAPLLHIGGDYGSHDAPNCGYQSSARRPG